MVSQFVSPSTLLMFALPAPSTNWLYQFANNLTNLTTQHGDALTQIGLTELSFVSLMVLILMVAKWSTDSMTFRLHHEPLRAGDLVTFLVRLVFCCLLENYWTRPLPGTSFGFNHLFSYFAQAIVQTLDQNSLDSLLQLLSEAGQHTLAPALTAPIEILIYLLIQVMLGITDAILFLINVSGFILYGVCALFGPIMIPLYMTKTFRGKFLGYIDQLLSLAMIRAVAAAFIFVWQGFLNGFVQQTFNHDYSMVKWIANLLPCMMVFLAFDINLLFVPAITTAIFGGGNLAAKAEEAAVKLAAVL